MSRKPNQSQQEAIEQTEGPVLIIAGPGSGKTFTLIERIIKLIKKKKGSKKGVFMFPDTDSDNR